jgi:triacylglycerol lipase
MGKHNNVLDSSWYENDGVVNSVSMTHPVGSEMVQFSGNPITGTWQTMEKLNMDHQAVIGHGVSKKQHEDLFVLYNKHCQLLYLLK